MTTFALLLVLAAAVMHASWNLALKRCGGGGIPFFWLVGLVEAALCAPLAAVQVAAGEYPASATACALMAGSAVLHVIYSVLLDRGYRSGALSVVYPLARATGPLLTIGVAVAFLGERPTPIAVAGAVAIGLGALWLSGNPFAQRAGHGRAIGFALATGGMIALYTLWDRQAVAAHAVPPLVYYGGMLLCRAAVMTPFALRDRPRVRQLWRQQRGPLLLIGVLSPLSYLLVLYAMQLAPISYVAPAREISILIAALLGTRLLREGDTARRLLAATVMVAGLTAIALGGR